MSEPSSIDARSPAGAGSAGTRDEGSATSRLDAPVQQALEQEFWRQHKRANVRRRRASLALAVPLIALFGIVDAYVAPEARGTLWLVRFGIFVPTVVAVLVLMLVRPLHRWSELAVLLGVLVSGLCLTRMALIAPEHYAGVLTLVFACYTFLGLRCVDACIGGLSITLLYAVAFALDGGASKDVLATDTFFLLAANLLGAFACHALEQAARRDFLRSRSLSEQRQVSDRLLRNVLPEGVARRLKSNSGTIAEAHPDVTILFADIVDFTRYAARVGPARLVRLLDEVFSRFDRLAELHGLDKIKTIGDAYMVAGGLGSRRADHAHAVAEMALDMLDCASTLQSPDARQLKLRVGIHTGPVVAGVIGRTRFAYDLWGDTVNVASRLESLAAPGTIQVSEPTRLRLRHDYAFSARRLLTLKGRGELGCYVLLARNAGLKEQPCMSDVIPARVGIP